MCWQGGAPYDAVRVDRSGRRVLAASGRRIHVFDAASGGFLGAVATESAARIALFDYDAQWNRLLLHREGTTRSVEK